MRISIIIMILLLFFMPRALLADVDLSIVASGTTPVAIGDTVFYDYLIANTSQQEDATGVIFSTALPIGVTFLNVSSPQGGCSPGDTIICAIPVIEIGQIATVQIDATIDDFGSYTHTAIVISDQVESNPSDNSVTVSTTLLDTRLESDGASGSCNLVLLLFIFMTRLFFANKPRQYSSGLS